MFILDPRDKTPIYEQMKHQLRSQIAIGICHANEPLPSVRQVALEMGVNPNTVQKAYRAMEADGLIYSIPGKGSFITFDMDAERRKQKQMMIQQLEKAMISARDAGVQKEELMELITTVYQQETKEGEPPHAEG